MNARAPTMLRAALWYGARNFEVFPVAKTKVPIPRHGHLEATTDPKQITAWWRAHPDANIGARCTWFWVLDGDFDKGGEHVFDGWRRVRGDFPRTWVQRTGGGGLHVFFRHDVTLDSLPIGRLYRGVDVKGGGRGYVLLAPSQSSKGPYKWIVSPRDAELGRSPRWLIREIVTVKQPRHFEPPSVDFCKYAGVDRVARARRYLRQLPPAVSGEGGHAATFKAAMLVARGFGLPEPEAFAVLAEWNQTCRPPWSERELRRKIQEATRRGSMAIGALLEKERAA